MLPEWLDLDVVRQGALGVIVVLGIGALLVLRFIQKLLVRIALLLVVAALAGGVYLYRDSLSECAETCSCTLLGQDIEISRRACQP